MIPLTPTRYRFPRANRQRRQGMALLFVVSLILFITLLGASFVVVSQQFSSSAKNRARVHARGDSGRTVIYRGLFDLLRGPELTRSESPLRSHSLLADQYGYGLRGFVAANSFTSTLNGNAISFPVVNASEIIDFGTPGFTLSTIDGAYNGLVLTFVSGPAKGVSTRIVGYNAATATFTVLPEWKDGNNPFVVPGPTDNSEILINGRAFFGWGGGGMNTVGIGAQQLSDQALRPNLTGQVFPSPIPADHYLATGVNESYDEARDSEYQNLFLAATTPGGFVPSFERTALFQSQGALANFRAFGLPYETGVGPVPLHVDNDFDGELDSIWMDLGYPIQTDIDGRRYKNLFAFMVMDLDRRFNVNIHGDLFDLDLDGDGLINRATLPLSNLLGNVNPFDPSNDNLPHGQGFGPPEITLAPLLGTDTDYESLLFSRYGQDQLPGNANIRDRWLSYEHFGHPDINYPGGLEVYPNQFVGGLFSSYLDIHGRYSKGIPHAVGVPIGLAGKDSATGLIPQDEIRNSAYEISFSPHAKYASIIAEASDDQPFSIKELERILRPFDGDVKMLPNRLNNLLRFDDPVTPRSFDDRHLVTTQSWEVPSIPGFDPQPILGEVPGYPVSIVERLYNVLIISGRAPVDASNDISILLSPETRMGLPLDINRAFGNGRDDNANGIYDEHSADPSADEAAGGENLRLPNGNNVAMDQDGNGTPADATGYLARYHLARHLYCLMLLVTDDTRVLASPEAITRRTLIAQWAINVVDFRDADSVCTPFEFDLNPFNNDGWSVDGVITSPQADPVVWGTERPELLITEAQCMHDRRTEDLDSVDGGSVSNGNDNNNDYDQQLVPNEFAFIELYNPWVLDDFNQYSPREFDATGTGVDLAAVIGAGGASSPVWRMVVANGGTTIDNDVPSNPASQLRRIYFTLDNNAIQNVDPDPVGVNNTNKVYWPVDVGTTVIPRGGYGVLGSSGTFGPNGYRSTMGRRDTPSWDSAVELDDQTRQICLDPSSDQVRIVEVDPVTGAESEFFRNAAVFPIGQNSASAPVSRSLGVSAPVQGYYDYASPGTSVTAVADGFQYNSALNSPVDTDPELVSTGCNPATRTEYRGVYLQRLANPLAPYDADLNPYITVDSAAMGLTSFNGADDDSLEPAGTDVLFASNERGRHENPDLSDPGNQTESDEPREQLNLWEFEPKVLPSDVTMFAQTESLTDNHHFGFEWLESFGLLNASYTEFYVRNAAMPIAPVGFSDMKWNNRPFASHYELMDVPYTNSFELAREFTVQSNPPGPDPYDPARVRDVRFGHLLNFYAPFSPGGPFPNGLGPLMDYVRVPSRFAGTDLHLSPPAGPPGLYAPFNIVSRFREPGKVNINGIEDDRIWNGVLGELSSNVAMNGFNIDGSPVVFASTGINKAADYDPLRLDNPIRNFADADKVAQLSEVRDPPVLATMMRQGTTTGPMFEINNNFPFHDARRSSDARHQLLQRLGNMTTTRSSVFAIWVTVGRFEVDEFDNLVTTGTGATEEGVELGSDTGKVERYRGFFIIDRSIPVGFEPGKNHNIERMILTETFTRE